MNDVLAKPFTKNGLFGILDKHLIHLKAIQLSGEVPRSMGVPPLSHSGLVDAFTNGISTWSVQSDAVPNPLAGMGWSDETYQLVLQVSPLTPPLVYLAECFMCGLAIHGNGRFTRCVFDICRVYLDGWWWGRDRDVFGLWEFVGVQ
jgi:hypothetical protein